MPSGATSIELDGVHKNLQYDPYGILQPYVTILDKLDTSHLSSVYLEPAETKTFILNYKTDSVTVFTSTYYPDYFKVGERAEITKVLTIKNQVEKNVSDLEYNIEMDYAEDLRLCDGEYTKGCPEEDDKEYGSVTLDTDSIVKGQYKLEIDELESRETKVVTITYYVPTVTLEETENGRRSIDGVLTTYRKYNFLSQATFTLDDVRYREMNIPCNKIVDIFACDINNICDIPLSYTCDTNLKLGTFGVGETKLVYLWYISDEEEEKKSLWDSILTFGNVYYLEKGSFEYYLMGLFGYEENGMRYITTGRILLIIASFLIFILFLILIVYFGKKLEKYEKNI
jgi:hypothetical protein